MCCCGTCSSVNGLQVASICIVDVLMSTSTRSQARSQALDAPYVLGPITLSYLRKMIGTFYLGPYIKLSVHHRVKQIALLSRRLKHYYLHYVSCKQLCVCDRGVNIKKRID